MKSDYFVEGGVINYDKKLVSKAVAEAVLRLPVYPTLSFCFIYDLSILRKDTVKLGGLAHRLNAVAYDA